jgi:hypothetical protein
MIPAGMVERGERNKPLMTCRKPVSRCRNRRVGTTSGTSSGDVLILPERHPAYRRREARLGSGMERENLTGDAKGKGASGLNREADRRGADRLVVVMKAL